MNQKALRQSAASLTGPLHKRLALISVGAVAAANVLLILLQLLTDHMMKNATGLDGLSRRAGLMTAQSVLNLVLSLSAPFWSYGFYKVAMDTARSCQPETKTLLWGFHRFWPLLRLLLLEVLIVSGLAMLGGTVGSMLYVNTPLSNVLMKYVPTFQAVEQLTDPNAVAALLEPILPQLLLDMLPLFLLVLVGVCVLVFPWFYKVRLAHYHILDGENRATVAMAISQQEMRGSRFAMFKLDLSWWWYYGLLMLASAPLYLPDILPNLSVPQWAFTLLSLGLQVLVQWQFMARVQTSYALTYDELRFRPMQESPLPTGFEN